MKLKMREKTGFSDLYIVGLSSPCKSPLLRSNFHTKSSPKERSPVYNLENTHNIDKKWFIRGHKFTTIYNPRKAKLLPEFQVAGKTHSRFQSIGPQNNLLIKQKTYTRPKTEQGNIRKKITIHYIKGPVTKNSSSKNLQVDPEDLNSWNF